MYASLRAFYVLVITVMIIASPRSSCGETSNPEGFECTGDISCIMIASYSGVPKDIFAFDIDRLFVWGAIDSDKSIANNGLSFLRISKGTEFERTSIVHYDELFHNESYMFGLKGNHMLVLNRDLGEVLSTDLKLKSTSVNPRLWRQFLPLSNGFVALDFDVLDLRENNAVWKPSRRNAHLQVYDLNGNLLSTIDPLGSHPAMDTFYYGGLYQIAEGTIAIGLWKKLEGENGPMRGLLSLSIYQFGDDNSIVSSSGFQITAPGMIGWRPTAIVRMNDKLCIAAGSQGIFIVPFKPNGQALLGDPMGEVAFPNGQYKNSVMTSLMADGVCFITDSGEVSIYSSEGDYDVLNWLPVLPQRLIGAEELEHNILALYSRHEVVIVDIEKETIVGTIEFNDPHPEIEFIKLTPVGLIVSVTNFSRRVGYALNTTIYGFKIANS